MYYVVFHATSIGRYWVSAQDGLETRSNAKKCMYDLCYFLNQISESDRYLVVEESELSNYGIK
jgi:hypothetical protein